MTVNAIAQLILYLAVLLLLTKPLGWYIAQIATDQPAGLNQILRPVEQALYRLSGIQSTQEMDWKQYTVAVILFNLLGVVMVYALQRLQVWLPLNPQHFPNVSPNSAFNTAISFATNTNWQGYSGETTLSYLTQMLGLAVQNFCSGATAIAVALALIRGLTRHTAQTIGNFWVDVTRVILYLLLPLTLLLALVLMHQGVIQNFAPYQPAHALCSNQKCVFPFAAPKEVPVSTGFVWDCTSLKSGLLTSNACGRGAGVRVLQIGANRDTLTPTPLPQAGEGMPLF